MSNNRFQSLNEYEQLKRKNRRRLVGASALVILAGLLLAKVLNQSEDDTQVQNITVEKSASAVQTASETDAPAVAVNNQPASQDDASDLSPAAVLEPAPEGDTQTTELSNPLTSPPPAPKQAETPPAAELAVLEPLPDTAPAPAPQSEEKKQPEEKTEKNTAAPQTQPKPQPQPAEAKPAPETAPPPVVVINNRIEPDAKAQAAEKAAAAKKAQEQKAAAERQKQAQQKAAAERQQAERQQQAEQQKKRQAEQEAGRLKAQQAKAKAEAEKKKQQEANRKAAQDALDNKSPHASEKRDPQAILDGNPSGSGGKAIIQAGAYSSREQARQVRQKLADAGISAYISETETSKGKIYRVRTGSYPSREAANRALAQIRRKGGDGIVIGQQ